MFPLSISRKPFILHYNYARTTGSNANHDISQWKWVNLTLLFNDMVIHLSTGVGSSPSVVLVEATAV